jgi:hypothetical protein
MAQESEMSDHAPELETRMPRGLSKDQFYDRARSMSPYLDHTAKYTENDIDRAWWWYDLGNVAA